MDRIKIYKNYGVLAAEKRVVYTYGRPHSAAVCSESLEVEIPANWKIARNYAGDILLESPWGTVYNPNEILSGDDKPCLFGYGEKGTFRYNLNVETN